MNGLNDFLKLIEEGKQDYIQNDPVGKKIEEVKQHVKSDLTSLFTQLSEIATKVEPLNGEFDDVINEVAEEINEVAKTINITPKESLPIPEIKPASQQYSQKELEKIYTDKSFQQPNPDLVSPQLDDIRKKIKLMEQAVGKIASLGPGSGEVNFRWLDDVNRATMGTSNDNWILEYDTATKKVQFTEDLGPVRTLKFNTSGNIITPVPGTVCWNNDEDCLNVYQNDGTTLQVGLEHYIRVHNHTSNNIANGTVVKFAGVENTNSTAMPVVDKYIADGQSTPLLLIGVMTTDLPVNAIGRATTFGYVRDLNTTGSDVGETWAQGDLLWGHPTLAGKMTNVRPTAPNVATSIAAVVRLGTTDGQLLVRPTIFPRLFFGDWYSTLNQTIVVANTPYRITLNQVGNVSGFTNNNGLITAQHAGLYNFQFSLQVISSNSSVQYFWIWYRKNGQDVPNSATKLSIASNSAVLAPSWNFSVSMQIGDTFELMWASDGLNISLSALPATSFCPEIPSVILTVQQVNL